ncbi:Deformed epidermal autoregulatory factor 1 [Amphibalanus amphitrite]|uniref:Deformed epidermal autoregulatory factor 1 n=1 Tax=Amphibalanus amphitrite TaxID=1232801 RepID=A0A6A4W4E5_AMPAM|nr:Deformed epidermal autoregulatory factor 1 [Amphibalanus amphitrite]
MANKPKISLLVRFEGRSLQSVIDAGLLLPHAASCACAICSDDPAVSAPVRLFTPYRKRKFRAALGSSSPPPAEPTSDAAGGLDLPDSGPDELELAEEISALPPDRMWDRLEEMSWSVLRQALTLKQIIRTCRERQASTASSNADGSGAGAQERSSAPTPSCVQPANEHTMCSNCNRPPELECGACHSATYCSTFCCQKDWESHRGSCRPAEPAPAPAPATATATATAEESTAAPPTVMYIVANGTEHVVTVSQS